MADNSRAFQAVLRTIAALCSLAFVLVTVRIDYAAESKPPAPITTYINAFAPGEMLTYDISWSRILSAGTATLSVEEDKLPDGRDGLRFVVTGRSIGLLDKLYPVNDIVESVFDPQTRESISFKLRESYGGKKRRRELVFDHTRNIVVSRLNDDPVETLTVPEHVQDGLSMLYYIRAWEDFVVGKVFTIEVHNSKKNWSVEIHTLSRERLKTPLGDFAAIKIKTYPKYRGVFANKGEVFIWLTDDHRRIPLLMKSKLAFGSFVFTLTGVTPEHFLEAPHQ
jgi:hypothetical protein